MSLGEAVEACTVHSACAAARERRKERYATDEEYRAARKASSAERFRDRYRNDPEWRAQYLAAQRERYLTDPELRQRRLERQRERRRTLRETRPEQYARELEYHRVYRARKAAERAAHADPHEAEVQAFVAWSVAAGLKKQGAKNRQAALRAYFRFKAGARS